MGFVAPGQEPAQAVATLRGWLDADRPDPLLIETSGSTGRPKRVVLTRDAVVASARAAQRRLGEPGPWALTLPPSYVAGVQVVVRSLLGGPRARARAGGATRRTPRWSRPSCTGSSTSPTTSRRCAR